ncbi:hypothetical protein N431DRAFT_471392 [Stipitochalara longipes BDJ]|nr:hypothetical protein N431DRAFT_471392 [Stipitochalara longipes BDJ]
MYPARSIHRYNLRSSKRSPSAAVGAIVFDSDAPTSLGSTEVTANDITIPFKQPTSTGPKVKCSSNQEPEDLKVTTHIAGKTSKHFEQVADSVKSTSSTSNNILSYTNAIQGTNTTEISLNTNSGEDGDSEDFLKATTGEDSADDDENFSDNSEDGANNSESDDGSEFDGPDTLTTFTIFSRLPIELRNKIWCQAAREVRVVELEWHNPEKMWIVCKKSTSLSPSIARVNKEARQEALRHYTVLHPNIKPKAPVSPACYFNLDVDVLYLTPWYNREERYSSLPCIRSATISKLRKTLLDNVQNVAVQGEELTYNSTVPKSTLAKRLRFLLQNAQNLKTLYIVIGDFDKLAMMGCSQCCWGALEKARGAVELTCLNEGHHQPYVSERMEGELQTEFESLADPGSLLTAPQTYTPGTKATEITTPKVSVIQALRGARLVKVDSMNLLTDWERHDEEEPYEDFDETEYLGKVGEFET